MSTRNHPCVACNIFGPTPHPGPDGIDTLCDSCYIAYLRGELRLYRTKRGGISARATPGADLVVVNKFHRPLSTDGLQPMYEIVDDNDHQCLPLPRNREARDFVLAQADIARGQRDVFERIRRDEETSRRDAERHGSGVVLRKNGAEFVVTVNGGGRESVSVQSIGNSSLVVKASSGRSGFSSDRRSGGRHHEQRVRESPREQDGIDAKVEASVPDRDRGGEFSPMRRVWIRFGITWRALDNILSDCARVFGFRGGWEACYLHSEGNCVLLGGQRDLREFFRVARLGGGSIAIAMKERRHFDGRKQHDGRKTTVEVEEINEFDGMELVTLE